LRKYQSRNFPQFSAFPTITSIVYLDVQLMVSREQEQREFPSVFAISLTIAHHSRRYNLALITEKTPPYLAKMECSHFYQLHICVHIKSVKLDRMSG